MSVLIDTNVFVDYLREDPRAITFLNQLREKPSTSIICVAELFSGAASQREERQIRQFLANVNVLTATFEIAERGGAFARVYRGSHNVGLADALIAATAEHHGLPLATLNVKHFPMFKKLKAAY